MGRYHVGYLRLIIRVSSSSSSSRSFSSSTGSSITGTATTSKSRRQDFKQLQVHPSILTQIETLGIGIPPRKKRFRSFLPSSSRATAQNRPIPPLPFGTKPRLVRHVASTNELIMPATTTTNHHESIATSPQGKEPPPPPTTTTTTPLLTIPEVAIAGRSNVGKSTLLNALLFDAHRLRKGEKAAVSSRPGETMQIAVYELERRLRVVDLPGYGFAYSQNKTFQELVLQYLLHRGSVLKRVLLLIDARHGFKTSDWEFLNLLQQQTANGGIPPPLQLVLTKCDTVRQADLARRVAQVKQQLSDALRREPKSFPVMLVSVKPPRQVAGVWELQKAIAMVAKKRKIDPTLTQTTATTSSAVERTTTIHKTNDTSKYPEKYQSRSNKTQGKTAAWDAPATMYDKSPRYAGTTTRSLLDKDFSRTTPARSSFRGDKRYYPNHGDHDIPRKGRPSKSLRGEGRFAKVSTIDSSSSKWPVRSFRGDRQAIWKQKTTGIQSANSYQRHTNRGGGNATTTRDRDNKPSQTRRAYPRRKTNFKTKRSV